ncbi:hypothetical protein ACFU8A_28630, partial [Streptomyces sp. NPDC057546]|uniref:hypothetical protein n=1 Tax=Streptomyces sp. NPDC057546 TaxID=3346165 RepID=UPI0036B34137
QSSLPHQTGRAFGEHLPPPIGEFQGPSPFWPPPVCGREIDPIRAFTPSAVMAQQAARLGMLCGRLFQDEAAAVSARVALYMSRRFWLRFRAE